MFIAMNHFRVVADQGEAFERAWRERESFLDGTDGFQSFHLLAGALDDDGYRQYASHTVWRDEASFLAWVQSDAFRKAHAQGSLGSLLAGPPQLARWTEVPMK